MATYTAEELTGVTATGGWPQMEVVIFLTKLDRIWSRQINLDT